MSLTRNTSMPNASRINSSQSQPFQKPTNLNASGEFNNIVKSPLPKRTPLPPPPPLPQDAVVNVNTNYVVQLPPKRAPPQALNRSIPGIYDDSRTQTIKRESILTKSISEVAIRARPTGSVSSGSGGGVLLSAQRGAPSNGNEGAIQQSFSSSNIFSNHSYYIPPAPPLPPPEWYQTHFGAENSFTQKAKKGREEAIKRATIKAKDILSTPLLPGEVVLKNADRVIEVQSNRGEGLLPMGVLLVTNYQLIFSLKDRSWKIPVSAIDKIKLVFEKLGTIEKECTGIEISCRFPHQIKLFSPSQSAMSSVMRVIEEQVYVPNVTDLFAFTYKRGLTRTPVSSFKYDMENECQRLGLHDHFVLTDINKNHLLCKTYPEKLVVHAKVCNTNILSAVASFRSKQRIPAIVWRHPTNNSVIARCSQPRAGLTGRSKEDEMLFDILASDSNNKELYLFDCRPLVNAVANQLMGAGTERKGTYQKCRAVFLNIENIHVMRGAQKRLFSAVFKGTDLNETDWLDHVSLVFNGVIKLVNLIHPNGTTVVVHCSDGWDRTPQLVALAQLILDPFYRTINGFQVLIEKEWLSFGHMFHKRTGYGNKSYRKKQASQKAPIFLQFIDCVWQLCRQFPYSFEFNEDYLTFLLYHSYSTLYGTFLCNSDKERKDLALSATTASLWDAVEEKKWMFTNPAFSQSRKNISAKQPTDIHACDVIIPKANKSDLAIWKGYYQSDNKFPWQV